SVGALPGGPLVGLGMPDSAATAPREFFGLPGSPPGAGKGSGGPPSTGTAGMPNGLPPLPASGGGGGGPAGATGGTAKAAGSPDQGAQTPQVARPADPDSVVGSMPSPGTKNARPAPPPLGRVLGNRDWLLYVECRADGVVLKYGNQRFSLAMLAQKSPGEHPLTTAVREVVARRQATVGPGEPPWRPMLRFQVQPDGLPA